MRQRHRGTAPGEPRASRTALANGAERTRPMRYAATGGFLLCLLQLAACGGGGGGGASTAPVAQAPVPAPAPAPVPTPAPAPAPAPTPSNGVPAGYTLAWSDEFDNPGLPDPAKWDYDIERNRLGWFNNELQYYSAARPANSSVADGRLRITARLESLSSAPDWGGQRYTSARLITRGKAAFTYGWFEIRAKLPCGVGTWPAIWTLGTSGVWPDDGELDIMEQVGSNPTRILGTVHTQLSGGTGTGGAVQVSDACSAFHDYQMLWTRNEIAMALDGVIFYRYANPGTGSPVTWPFNKPQYLLLNIAIGGTLGGPVNDSIFPVTMEIEHVRVWQAPP